MKKLLFYLVLILVAFSSHSQPLCLGRPNNYMAPVGAAPREICAADFNNDGFIDIVSANASQSDLSVLLGYGTGTFAPAATFSVGSYPVSVASGDFNNDGNLDLVSANVGSNNMSVIMGSGTGSFGPPTHYATGAQPYNVKTADFNNDGKLDIVVACINTNNVSVFMGLGSGMFNPAVNFIVGSSPYSVNVADFNNDGKKDLVTTNINGHNISVLLGNGFGSFGSPTNFYPGTSPMYSRIDDFNNDGKPDIAVVNYTSNDVSVFLATTPGNFAPAVNYSTTGTLPVYVTSADFNGDGKKDLVASNLTSNNVVIFLGMANGTFSTPVTFTAGSSPAGLLSADFNGDAKPDLAFANSGLSNVAILLNGVPLPTVTVGSASICIGQSFTLSPNGASSYTFSGGSAVVSPTTTTSYSVIGSNTMGCVSAVAAIANITVSPNSAPVITVNSGSICLGQSFTMNPNGANTYTFSGNSAVVSPTASTSYMVVGTNTTTGCVSSAVVSSVAVILPPVISVSGGSICAGQSFTLNPNGASSYSYSGNSITIGSGIVNPTTTTSYSVTGANSAGCISSPVVANVTVHALPLITANSGTICAGQSFTITPNGAVSFTFMNGGPVVTPSGNSTYTIAGTSSLGCVASAEASTVIVNATFISVNSGSICSGQNFTIVPSGAQTYTFSSGSAVVSPTVNTTYTITGTSSSGCMTSLSAISNVTVLPVPSFIISGNYTVCANSPVTQITNGSAVSYSWSDGSTGNLVTLTPSVSTLYTVTGTGANNCTTELTKLITVIALPSLTINPSAPEICMGGSLALTASGASSYTWSPAITNSVPFSPTSTATYSLIGMDPVGCKSATIINISVNPVPTLTVLSTANSICEGETATLTVDGASTYSWSDGATAGSNLVSPTVTTIYSVIGTDVKGCSSTAIIIQNVGACTGLKNISPITDMLQVFPNPTDGKCTVKIGKDMDVTVLNTVGQVVLSGRMTKGENSIDLEKESPGIYFIRFKQENSVKTIKLIKN